MPKNPRKKEGQSQKKWDSSVFDIKNRDCPSKIGTVGEYVTNYFMLQEKAYPLHCNMKWNTIDWLLYNSCQQKNFIDSATDKNSKLAVVVTIKFQMRITTKNEVEQKLKDGVKHCVTEILNKTNKDFRCVS